MPTGNRLVPLILQSNRATSYNTNGYNHSFLTKKYRLKYYIHGKRIKVGDTTVYEERKKLFKVLAKTVT